MYLISVSDFQREYSIPNATETYSDSGKNTDLYIDDKVRLFLYEILGNDLFNDLDSNIENGQLKPDAAQRWKDFVNGKDNYKGLIFNSGLFKESCLIPLVYSYWLEDNVTKVAEVGEVNIKSINAVSVVSTKRIVNAWNTFVNMYQGNHGHRPFKGIVKGVPFCDYYGSRSSFVSVRQFLLDNKETYPDAPVPTFEHRNSFGL